MITKINIFDVLLYQNVLNPLAWLVFFIRLTLSIILLLIFIALKIFKKHHSSTSSLYEHFRSHIDSSLMQLIGIFINSFWYNRRKTLSYSRYLTSTIIPRHPFHDWRTVKTIQNNYNHFLSVKNRKLR